jgi:hypothetical protein
MAAVNDMWETLTYHIKNAKYVRFYDGFMGRITSDVLQGLDILNPSVVRMPVTSQSNRRTMYIKPVSKSISQSKWLISWAMDIGRHVATGKNFMVFYPFKTEKASWPAMSRIVRIICTEGNIDAEKDTVMHFGGMDGKEKTLILSNLGIHWKKRVVLANSAVTAGVDFTPLWFHRLYAYVSGYHNPREIIQWLSKAR